MRRFLLLTLLIPSFALAAEMEAGFPSQAIWSSKSAAVEGETLVLSAVVYNSNESELHATLVFTANGTRIGAREFELGSGGSQIHSVEWKPKAGEYQVVAQLEGTSAELAQRETPAIIVKVASPPPPSATEQALSTAVQVGSGAAQAAGTIASSAMPFVLGAAQSIGNVIEPFRQKGIERLEKYLESAQAGRTAGTSTSNVRGFEEGEKKGSDLLANIGQTAAAAALFALKNPGLFYPLLALSFFALLYFLARRIRRMPRE